MISQITIQNFGLIEKVSLELCGKLNVLTGETGAGKSILIDALRYALGERLDQAQVRDPAQPCVVEVVVEISKTPIRKDDAFKEYFSSDEDPLIINRAYLPDGRNRIKINGFSATVGQLKELGNHLVDFHGPHDHQMLFSVDSHIVILDRLCEMENLNKEYDYVYSEYKTLCQKQEDIRASAASRERNLDLLSHQIKELGRVPLQAEKYQDTIEKQAKLNNCEKLYESAAQLIEILENEESGVAERLRKAFAPLKTLKNLDQSASAFEEKLDQAQGLVDELLDQLRSYNEGLSFEPDEARDISARCDIYYDIIRKYGPTIDDAEKFYKEAKEKYDFLVDLEHNDSEICEKINFAAKRVGDIAQKISTKRKKAATGLEKTIEKELKDLGIAHVRFECRITKIEPNSCGQDEVVFYISPNAGEALKPLAEIVSSGEAARVMLALKKALTNVDPIPVLIFDEIDSQIGGRLGTITGGKLKELSKDRQVILITHLPQIASFADSHFKVSKKVENNRTITTVVLLDSDGRVKEMAKMMSGEKESGISITHAHEMLSKAAKA